MKKIIFIAILAFTNYFFAQGRDGKQKVRAYKIAYLTEKLDLSSNEAEKFWPIYNTYSQNRRKNFKAEKNNIKAEIEAKGGVENFNDREAKDILDRITKLRDTQHQNKVNLRNDLKAILTAKKILQFELAESEFNKKMMKRLREQKKCN